MNNLSSKKLEEYYDIRRFAFITIIISTIAVTTSIFTMPVLFNYVQYIESPMNYDISFCKSKTDNIWKEIVTVQVLLNSDGKKFKRYAQGVFTESVATFDNIPTGGGCCGCGVSMPGLQGAPGVPGKDGAPGPDGMPGQDGPELLLFQLPLTNPDFCFDCPTPLPGPMGKPGPKGKPGNEGRPGTPGQNGKSGIGGVSGMPGQQGKAGQPGNEGAPGIPGVVIEVDGPIGPIGLPGLPGSAGIDGQPGQAGPDGEQGMIGLSGDPGSNGEPGKPGKCGNQGEPGAQGENGSCSHCPVPRTAPGY
ncbi:Nematode cuticle collagen, N-terminal domain and Collagen triple helix repeat-containing protein [Strongyloides ratti]|uniref:Nematode cuticle collagen, N-terminal domain and Collagen triple helix repeat-containing protein n=1 Tax=Strongyloides ratti TaxID=34506 RepID=A0A090L4W5_STRRB|nr:Nematode cuticle collagen, N-terminal domain and Collagen triple helix repeat-containing protein [Strongyloides ratti]CEF63152.1 Nematode cuticle collagen, N-terminal domain and Collagen triple helix repeat-containing protein [Strongyloides ratti]